MSKIYSSKIWNFIKPLSGEIEIFEDTVDCDVNDLPSSYIVYRSDITNTVRQYSDGKPFLRSSLCQIDLFISGNANTEGNRAMAIKIEKLLRDNQVNYNKVTVGYLFDLKRTQITYEFNLI